MSLAHFLIRFHVAIARMFNSSQGRLTNFKGYFASLALLTLLVVPAMHQPDGNTHSPESAAAAAPFRAGETLDFSGQWSSISDAFRVTIKAVDDNLFHGRSAWHFQAQCHTNSYLHYIFPVDDQYDSYSAQSSFAGMQFELYLHEPGKSESHILRLASTQTPAPSGATQVQVLPGTRDPLGFTYYLRTVNWNQTAEVRSPVFEGHKLYEVRARVATPRGEITVPAGEFSATGISIRLFDHGAEIPDIHLMIWFAQDAAHTPILIEMELPFGRGRIELTSATGGG